MTDSEQLQRLRSSRLTGDCTGCLGGPRRDTAEAEGGPELASGQRPVDGASASDWFHAVRVTSEAWQRAVNANPTVQRGSAGGFAGALAGASGALDDGGRRCPCGGDCVRVECIAHIDSIDGTGRQAAAT